MRELKKLHEEIVAYPQEASLWQAVPGLSNPGGNLAIHLIGNLNFYIGAALGQTGYERDKTYELTVREVPRAEILELIEGLMRLLPSILDHLPKEMLERDFPLALEGKIFSTELILHHVMAHFGYHLGQINYHRRMISAGLNS
ncbi:MAG: DinB family protein [Microscillaceae bacterium]|nr:DinB family protein [Microscillaceae bacterium]